MPPPIDVITSFKPANSLEDPGIWTWQMDHSSNPPSPSSILPVCACMYKPYVKPAHCHSVVARELFWAWYFSPARDPEALYIHVSFWHSLSLSACQLLPVVFHRAQAHPVSHTGSRVRVCLPALAADPTQGQEQRPWFLQTKPSSPTCKGQDSLLCSLQ